MTSALSVKFSSPMALSMDATTVCTPSKEEVRRKRFESATTINTPSSLNPNIMTQSYWNMRITRAMSKETSIVERTK